MKHLGWDMRLDEIGDIYLHNLRTGATAYIIIFEDTFYAFPDDIPWKIIDWSLRKSAQHMEKVEEKTMYRRDVQVWSPCKWGTL